MRTGIYVRVSSEEQVQGYSLDAQARLARDYCEAHGWTCLLYTSPSPRDS